MYQLTYKTAMAVVKVTSSRVTGAPYSNQDPPLALVNSCG